MGVPKLFRKSYTREQWEKKVLRYVYLPKEQQFLNSFLREEPDGKVSLEIGEETPKETINRVKRLAKEIRANRQIVSLPKLGILIILGGLVAGSYYFLRNRLVEKGIVAALEGVFQAKAEVEGVDFALFKGRISWKKVAVADKDKPMRNLFELGPSAADLDLAALLRGRVLIEELRVEGIQWNTERKTSGVLPERVLSKDSDKGTGSIVGTAVVGLAKEAEKIAGDLARRGLQALQEVNVEALVQEQLEKLETTRLVQEAEVQFKEKERVLHESVDRVTRDLEQIGSEVNTFRKLDVRTLTNPDEILQTVQRAESILPRVKQVRDTGQGLHLETLKAVEKVNQLQKNLETAVRKDMEYTESLISIASNEAGSLAGMFFYEGTIGSLLQVRPEGNPHRRELEG